MEKGKDLSTQEVISTKQKFCDVLLNDAQKIIAGEKEKMRRRRLIFPFVYPEFQNLIKVFGNTCLTQRNQDRNFVIDKFNEPVIKQLYLYVTGNSSFTGDLAKGLLLQGKYGCGKTVLLETYSMLHNHIVRKLNLNYPVLRFVKSVQLQEQIKEQSMEMFVKRPLIIDEFGRESKTVMDYGNISRPISELLSLRSDVGTITHATSNFTFKTLSSDEFYGGMIGDRLKTMFNFITMKGESRRQ
ncbi:hypothetical protein [uncultured Draconibacterium sp.]|uniref:hypothetical protein n=1 Tax=uncultured Draconibacterium sp. TaxID=1573823 RepID=UPI0029C704CB|nr:hypothetical protein [uncultured Draconibacterium sp.]